MSVMTTAVRLARSLSALAHAAEDLLLPRACAGCGLPDGLLCPACDRLFQARVERALPPLLVASGRLVSCASYEGVVRSAILEWKDHGDIEVGGPLGRRCADLTDWALGRLDWEPVRQAGSHGQVIAVVPAPSSRASRLRRGRLQTHELARAVVGRLLAAGLAAQEVEGLSLTVGKKSVELSGARARQKRSAQQLRVRRQRFPPACGGVLLVDDIVTTGATLLGCARALRSAGLPVVAALTLACVPG